MWHHLIQFTPLYTRICAVLGKSYIHHNPTDTSEVKAYDRTNVALKLIFGEEPNPLYWGQRAGFCNYCTEFDCDNNAIPTGAGTPSYLTGFNALFQTGSHKPTVVQ